jgi:putative ABC transport system substrate-binding protein
MIRVFIALVAGASLAWAPGVLAQEPVSSIGSLNILSSASVARFMTAFRDGLGETGFEEGKNLAIEYRWAEGRYHRLPAMAADLAGRHPGAIFAVGPPAVAAARAATTTIPIVFLSGLDPVQAGFVASLSRPGGNITGVNLATASLGAKRLALLMDIVPGAARIGLLVNPANPNTEVQRHDIEMAARPVGRPIEVVTASEPDALDAAFAALKAHRVDALIVGADPFLVSQRDRLVALAARHRIPTIYDWREYAVAGGLMSYGSSLTDAYRLAGLYAGRILKGDRAADLPVVQPSRYGLVINLKAAKALGLDVPRLLLAGAEEVIE